MKRIVVYVEEDVYRKLKSLLALRGLTVSGWFRNAVQRLLDGDGRGASH